MTIFRRSSLKAPLPNRENEKEKARIKIIQKLSDALEMGNVLFDKEIYEGAIGIYTVALSFTENVWGPDVNREKIKLLEKRSLASKMTGEWQAALEDANSILGFHEEWRIKGNILKGDTLLAWGNAEKSVKAKKFDDAEKLYKRLLSETNRENIDYLIGMGAIKFAMNKMEDGIVWFREAERLLKLGFASSCAFAPRVAIIGGQSVGKSTLFSKLITTKSDAKNYGFDNLTYNCGIFESDDFGVSDERKARLYDLPGIADGVVQGRDRQIIALARASDVLIMVLEANGPDMHRDLLEKELESVGIRLNKKKPNIQFETMEHGGFDFSSTINLTKCNKEMVQSVLQSFEIYNAKVIFHEDCSKDEFIDVVKNNRVYLPCLYVYNKIDKIEPTQQLAKGENTLYVSCVNEKNLKALKKRLSVILPKK